MFAAFLRCLGAVLLGALLVGTTPAFGAPEDPPSSLPEDAPNADEPTPTLTVSELEKWLEASDSAFAWLLFLRFGPPLVGIVLLVFLWRRFDRARLQPREPVPPPTSPFPPAHGLMVVFLVFFGAMFAIAALLEARPDFEKDIVFRMVAMQAVLLPLAVVVLLRRRRLGAAPHVRGKRVLSVGLGTFCIASLVVLPAALLSYFLLEAMGRPLTLYGPLQQVVTAPDATMPLALTACAVFLAPLTEECAFRGVLHPSVRALAGGGRRGAWAAALLVSAFFALIHGHELSFLPLFALAMVFAWVLEATDSLGATILAHAFFNAASLVPLLVRKLA